MARAVERPRRGGTAAAAAAVAARRAPSNKQPGSGRVARGSGAGHWRTAVGLWRAAGGQAGVWAVLMRPGRRSLESADGRRQRAAAAPAERGEAGPACGRGLAGCRQPAAASAAALGERGSSQTASRGCFAPIAGVQLRGSAPVADPRSPIVAQDSGRRPGDRARRGQTPRRTRAVRV